MTGRHRHVLPTQSQYAADNAQLRAAVQKDADLLEHWADSIGMVRPAQAVRMRMRRDELRKLLNPAAEPTPGVPVSTPAAEAMQHERSRPRELTGRAKPGG